MIKVGVVGATGYTGEELVEVLLKHPEVEVTSLSASARLTDEVRFSDLHSRFGKMTSLMCSNLNVDEVAGKADAIFLALPHTVSMTVAAQFIAKGKKIIDLSADYRLQADVYEKWYGVKHVDDKNLQNAVYGLPEINRETIKNSDFIANPGCYPTSVILGLMPIVKAVSDAGVDIIVDAKSGVTGAGKKVLSSLMFSEVAENFKCYKPNEHQHMPEMEYILSWIAGSNVKVNFVPHLLPIRRGILSTIYVKDKGLPDENEVYKLYKDAYINEPFVRLLPQGEMPQIKDVANTNFCDIGVTLANGMLVVVSVIDNLLKGAAGQAVQNMNIMYGLDEKMGLI